MLQEIQHGSMDKTSPWFCSLIRAGKHAELLAIESSVRSKLGVTLEGQLRGLQVLTEFEENKGIFSADFRDKKMLNSGMMALTDLSSVFSAIDVQIPGKDEALAALVGKAGALIESLIVEIGSCRSDLKELAGDTKQVNAELEDMAGRDSTDVTEGMKALIEKYNAEEGKALLQKFVESSKMLRELDDLATTVLWWSTDLTKTIGETKMQLLKALLEDEPKGSDLLAGVYALMAADLLSKPSADTSELNKDLKSLSGFASAGLQLTKKDLNPHAQKLIDVKLKASFCLGGHAARSSSA